MNIKIRWKELAALFVAAAIAASLAAGIAIVSLPASIAFATAATLFVLGVVAVEAYRRLEAQSDMNYRQVEAALSLVHVARPEVPLPPMRGWAITPDLGALLYREIRARKPAIVLEAGSGVSSVIVALALRANGHGKLISLDHEARFAARTRELLDEHGLNQIAVVVHAPLCEVRVEGGSWLWYSPEALKGLDTVDLFIVDGPPQSVQKLARYPALPIVEHLLSPSATVILDDAHRPDEKEIARRWAATHPQFVSTNIDTERGTVIMRRTSGTRNE